MCDSFVEQQINLLFQVVCHLNTLLVPFSLCLVAVVVSPKKRVTALFREHEFFCGGKGTIQRLYFICHFVMIYYFWSVIFNVLQVTWLTFP